MARPVFDGATVERMVKAGLTLPPGSQVTNYSPGEVAAIAGQGPNQSGLGFGPLNTVPDATAALPRGPAFGQQWAFGPGVPVLPAPISPRAPDGHPYPRRSEYPMSWNLPGVGQQAVPWRVLRQASDIGIIRRAIQIRKQELAYLDWAIVPNPMAVRRIAMAEANGDQRAVRNKIAADLADDVDRVTQWFQWPDRLRGLMFSDWLAMCLEDHFRYDAVSVYPWRTMDGDLHSLISVDGSTVKPLLDVSGNRPQPPDPAFQQMIYGFPRGDYLDSGGADGEFAADELGYFPMLCRNDTPYGLSPVEEVLNDLDVWLKRQEWIRSEYSSGVQPEAWVLVDADWPPELCRQWEIVLNELLSGNTQERHRLRVLPRGMKPDAMPQFAEKYTPLFDEFLLKLVVMHFDLTPIELGFEPAKGGLGGKGFSESMEDTLYRRGIRPYLLWMTGWNNHLAIRYVGMNPLLTFQFEGIEDEDEDAIAKTRSTEQRDGIWTVNDRRAERGLPLFDDIPEANEPMIVAGATIQPLRGLMTALPDTTPAGTQPTPPSKPTTPSPPSSAEPPSTTPRAMPNQPGAEEEAKKFLAFATKRARLGTWRPFEFASPLMKVSGILNDLGAGLDMDALRLAVAAAVKGVTQDPLASQRARMRPLHSARDAVAAKYARKVRTAFRNLVRDIPGAVRAYADRAGSEQTAKATKPDPSKVQHAKTVLASNVTPEARRVELMVDLRSEAYVAGQAGAQAVLAGDSETPDLTNWRAQAALLSDDGSRGLAGLLSDADVSIRSIADNRLDDLAQALADGIDNGDPMSVVADAIRDMLDDPSKAEQIAQTETARAVTVASQSEWAANGVEAQRFLADPDSCALCIENEAVGVISMDDDFPNGDPPCHPSCSCDLAPADVSEMDNPPSDDSTPADEEAMAEA
jgi:hypothetical protein